MAIALNEAQNTQPVSQPTEHPHIDKVEGVRGGRAKIIGTRIPVWIIAGCLDMGQTPEEILQSYPQLSMGKIHDAISYYYDHLEEIEQDRYDNSEEVVRAKYNIQ
jgi:uncharacterized protein (DUF433 family)